MVRRRILLGVLLGALFAAGWWAGRGRAANGLYSSLDLFVEVLHAVQTNYVDPVQTQPLMQGAMHGLVRELDPWSRYLDPAEFQAARAASDGSFDGVGAALDVRDGWPLVISAVEGSPAWDAGLEPGDVITRIDGHGTQGLGLGDVSSRLRGPAGTTVRLALTRPGEDGEREVTVTRGRVFVSSVPYAFVAAPGVGYLRLAQFAGGAARQVQAALDTLHAAGARSLVLDLRGDPGGSVDEAVAIAGDLLPAGDLVATTHGRTPDANRRYTVAERRPGPAWPVVALVDGGSASASEIVAGALQDHDRALLVGEPTFGKGLVQTVYPLRDRAGALQLTTAWFLTPSGRTLHRPGVTGSDDTGDDDTAPADTAAKPAPVFHTDGGRVVHGGGGLEPDLVVHPDSLPPLARTLED
ncbi:MAG TPA: S41 family peptidase, partial [Candidatus Eisenbacteria bacterium]|nr:S41 family peptidase [Candidatus Eisenbacteria bacterium]